MRRALFPTAAALGLALAACQAHPFVFQPDAVDGGVHLGFTVASPSKADLLFVIDNTGSMDSKQSELASSLAAMLGTLGAQDTSYRIGIVSTDTYGDAADCDHKPLPAVASNTFSDPRSGALGNCARPEVTLRRPHDGTLGRLIAAYDPSAFAAARFAGLSPAAQAAVAQMVPTGATSGPAGVAGVPGARWLIDHDAIREEACAACSVGRCDDTDPAYAGCVLPATAAMVQAYFQSNVAGLGTRGFGYAAGLQASLWAVGIDPTEATDAQALAPTYDLLAAGAQNQVPTAAGQAPAPWLRDDAILAVMYVSDQEDCSMPPALLAQRSVYEEPGMPAGSICNQPRAQDAFVPVARVADLFAARKGGAARVAVGAVAGLSKAGTAAAPGRVAEPHDCAASASPAPPVACACRAGDSDSRWCQLTDLSDPSLTGCTALSARRYVAVANHFGRRTFESICRTGDGAYTDALDDFARVATVSCFGLEGTRPAADDPNNVVVERSAQGDTAAPAPLPQTRATATTPGWYYDPVDNKVCLTGLDRNLGDIYDIYVRDVARADYSR